MRISYKILNEYQFNDFQDYEIDPVNRVLLKYKGTDKHIVIPMNINGIDIDIIQNSAFKGTNIESVIIPNTIQYLGNSVFESCPHLTSIQLPRDLPWLGKQIFSQCFSLQTIKLPLNLKKIPEYTFNNCRSLTTIDLPSTLIEIDKFAFFDCQGLTELVIPPSVNHMGAAAFFDCVSLKKLTIPSDLIVDSDNFSGCHNLQKVIIDPYISSKEKDIKSLFINYKKVSFFKIENNQEVELI